MNIITLNIHDAMDSEYDLASALNGIAYQAEHRNLWVYDSATDLIWFKDRNSSEWSDCPLEGMRYYMTHLFHNNILTEFEGTDTIVYEYMETLK